MPFFATALCALACAGGISAQQRQGPVKSLVTVYNVTDGSNKVVYTAEGFYQAPNWSPDGKYLLMNAPGRLVRLWLDGARIEPVETGTLKGINNDHGITNDGKWLAISAGQIYVMPASGGVPRQLTSEVPSYFHGFSPDGKWLAYCAPRNKNLDIYRIGFDGGAEQRLTAHAGYDDGPEYSPNGKWILFLSFEKGIPDHPANKNIVLRMMRAPGARPGKPKIRELVKLFGGQGTINVNSWSPDSRKFAYVSYELQQK